MKKLLVILAALGLVGLAAPVFAQDKAATPAAVTAPAAASMRTMPGSPSSRMVTRSASRIWLASSTAIIEPSRLISYRPTAALGLATHPGARLED